MDGFIVKVENFSFLTSDLDLVANSIMKIR